LAAQEPASPLSVGIAWAYRVTSLGLEFALPACAGYWIDQRFGSLPWGVMIGSVLGFAAGMTHLLRIARHGSAP